MARCLLIDAKLPTTHTMDLQQPITYAIDVTNNEPRKRHMNSSLEENLRMHIFGSTCFTKVEDVKKLDSRAKRGVFLLDTTEEVQHILYTTQLQRRLDVHEMLLSMTM